MYRTYYRAMTPRTRKTRQQPADVVASADVVWGAAAYADRVNGGEYRKEPEYLVREDGTLDGDTIVRQPNKIHMWQAIKDNSLITDTDRDLGRAAHDYVRKNLVIKGLKDTLSEFDQALSHAVEMEQFLTGADRYEIALVTSQIRAWREGTRMEAVLADVDRTPVAAVGEKVSLDVTVVKAVYSTNYNVYFITAKTDQNQMVFFSYREKLPVGQHVVIRGAVKAHRPDATQLNRVRVV
jgi:hypothetical protein